MTTAERRAALKRHTERRASMSSYERAREDAESYNEFLQQNGITNVRVFPMRGRGHCLNISKDKTVSIGIGAL